VPEGAAAPRTPGIYNWQQGNVSYPFLAVMKKPAARHMVFAMRACNTPIDWRQGAARGGRPLLGGGGAGGKRGARVRRCWLQSWRPAAVAAAATLGAYSPP
jgi:hypothetical protein